MWFTWTMAFDMVPHNRLLNKLSYGIDSHVMECIWSFLSDREMRVVVRWQASAWCSVLSGVLQGSILRPLWFLL